MGDIKVVNLNSVTTRVVPEGKDMGRPSFRSSNKVPSAKLSVPTLMALAAVLLDDEEAS